MGHPVSDLGLLSCLLYDFIIICHHEKKDFTMYYRSG